MKNFIVVTLTLLTLAIPAIADLEFIDDFENEDLVASGNPEGWTIFGTPLLDRGTMHNSDYHSPTAAVWVAINWTSWGWGATTVSNETTRYDVVDDQASISCWLRATNAFSAQSVAFTIYDADGTQWRTADASLHQLSASWAEYTTPLDEMVVEVAGGTAGLDYTNVVNFGFLAYTAGQSGGNMVQFDDFRVDSIPEPSTLVIMLGAMGVFLARTSSRRRRFTA